MCAPESAMLVSHPKASYGTRVARPPVVALSALRTIPLQQKDDVGVRAPGTRRKGPKQS